MHFSMFLPNRVLYFSIHRYEHGSFWPNLRESNYDYIGEGNGKGFNFNVPLNSIGMANQDFLAILHQVLLPVAYEVSLYLCTTFLLSFIFLALSLRQKEHIDLFTL